MRGVLAVHGRVENRPVDLDGARCWSVGETLITLSSLPEQVMQLALADKGAGEEGKPLTRAPPTLLSTCTSAISTAVVAAKAMERVERLVEDPHVVTYFSSLVEDRRLKRSLTAHDDDEGSRKLA